MDPNLFGAWKAFYDSVRGLALSEDSLRARVQSVCSYHLQYVFPHTIEGEEVRQKVQSTVAACKSVNDDTASDCIEQIVSTFSLIVRQAK